MTIMAMTITPDTITLIVDGKTRTLTSESHSRYDEIRALLKDGDREGAEALLDLTQVYQNAFAGTSVTIEHGVVKLDGVAMHGVLADRMLTMNDEGFDVGPMARFMENLHQNPSYRSVEQLYGFLEASDLPITEDGHFLAYKMVRDNYTDHHTGTFDNSVGAIPEMKRNMVDDDPNSTCSRGLHFCSQNYLGFYGARGRTMIVKVNPRDVVSIPVDYKNAKGRACRYEIVGELEQTSFTTKPNEAGGENAPYHSFGKSVVSDREARGDWSGRKMKLFEGVEVLETGEPRDGDVVFKGRFAEILDLDFATVTDLVRFQDVETVESTSGKKLIVWRDSYHDDADEWQTW